MGPVMPPSKKPEGTGVSVSSGLSQCYGGSSCSSGLQDDEELDFSLPATKREKEKGAMEDEELTNLNWLHESKNLLKSFGDTVLRSVSPVQDVDEDTPPSPAHSDLPYDAKQNPNCKPPYSFSCLIFMAIEDSPNKRLPVKDIYNWILEHFPYFENAPTGWKNSVRHNLSLNKCFKKVDKDRSQIATRGQQEYRNLLCSYFCVRILPEEVESIGKGSLWCIDPEYRQNLIQALKKTPYHSFSHVFNTPPTSPQTYQRTSKMASIEMNGTQADGVTRGHKLSRESDDQSPGVVKPLSSPDARKTRFTSWVEGTSGTPTFPVSAFFKRNGVLLQDPDIDAASAMMLLNTPPELQAGLPPGVIQNGAHALNRGAFDGVKPLPINPIGSVAAGVRNGIGNCRLKNESEPLCDSPVVSSDPKEDHNYSSAKSSNNRSMSPASDSISTSSADDHYEFTTKGSQNGSEGGAHSQESHSEAEEEDRKAHKKEAKDPLADSGYASQHKKKQHLLKAKKPPSDTLPLKKRRTEKPPESDDEEMKEAAGSLLHLAGIRSCLNNITNRTAKGQKEQKEKETTKN